MKDGLTEQDREGIRSVLASETKVYRAVIFGSRAMETYRPSSDLDLALYGEAMGLKDLARIQSKLAELNLSVDVDLLVHASVENKDLKEHIKTFGREWYRRM